MAMCGGGLTDVGHCPTPPLGTGQLAVPNVSDSNVSIALPSSGPYRGIIIGMGGLPLGQNTGTNGPILALPAGARLDSSGVSYSSGNATITDPSCVSGDVGSSVSPGIVAPPFNIPSTAVVQTANPGVSFTVQNDVTGLPTGSGTSVVMNANANTALGRGGFYAFVQMLNNAGWIVASVLYPEQYALTTGAFGQWNDMLNDAGFGSRYKMTLLRWYPHIEDYFHRKFGWTIPLVPFGASSGGFHALLWAINRQAQLLGYMSAFPATLWSNPSTAFTTPINFGPAVVSGLAALPNGTSGLDLGPTDLNAVTIPGMVGWGTSDTAVGFSQTTVAAGSAGANVAALPSGNLFVADETKVNAGPLIQVATSAGTAWLSFASKTAGELSGCTLLAGSGTVSTGGAVVQSLTDAVTAAAITAGRPVTRYSDGGQHSLTVADANAFAAWVISTLNPLAPAVH